MDGVGQSSAATSGGDRQRRTVSDRAVQRRTEPDSVVQSSPSRPGAEPAGGARQLISRPAGRPIGRQWRTTVTTDFRLRRVRPPAAGHARTASAGPTTSRRPRSYGRQLRTTIGVHQRHTAIECHRRPPSVSRSPSAVRSLSSVAHRRPQSSPSPPPSPPSPLLPPPSPSSKRGSQLDANEDHTPGRAPRRAD